MGCRIMQMNASLLLGYSYYRLEQYGEAIRRYEKGKGIAEELGYDEERQRLHDEISRCSLLSGNVLQGQNSKRRKKRRQKSKQKAQFDEEILQRLLLLRKSSASEEEREGDRQVRLQQSRPGEGRAMVGSLTSAAADCKTSPTFAEMAMHVPESEGQEQHSEAASTSCDETQGQQPGATPSVEKNDEMSALLFQLVEENARLRAQMETVAIEHTKELSKCQQEIQQVLQDISRSQEEQDVKSECVICLQVADLMALLPCGHLCVCSGCAHSLRQCPLCCAAVAHTVRIFTP